MILTTFVLVMLALLFWLGHGVSLIGRVSQGEKIAPQSAQALLLIDLQTVFWESGFFDPKSKAEAELAVLAEISEAKSNQQPVIAICQQWSIPSTKLIARLAMKGMALEGSKGTEVALPFAAAVDHVVIKRVQDAFETGELDLLLQKHRIGKLRIVGLDGNYCVAKTAEAACLRAYQVEVVSKAVLSSDQVAFQKTTQDLTRKGVVFI